MLNKPQFIFIITAVSFAIYANTLNNEFVSDDIPAIAQNPRIGDIFHSLNPFDIKNSLTYFLGKLNPFAYHLTNIIFHSLNSVLVFFFLRAFFHTSASFWGALIFTAHPVHTEAVTWISGGPYALSTSFLLISLLLYIRSHRGLKFKIASFLGSLLSFFLAQLTSTFALVYPGVLVLYDITFGRWRRNYRLWLVFFALVFLKLMCMFGAITERVNQVSFDTGATGWSNPVFNLAHSVFSHLSLLLWPKDLTLYHEPLSVSAQTLRLEIAFLILLILGLPFLFRKAKPLFFAVGLFILCLAPTYSPVMISWLVAERYLYFPSLAWSIVIAFLVDKYAQGRKMGLTLNTILIFLIAVYSIRTVIRNLDWKTYASIWRATVKVSPESAKAHNNMGDVYCLEGNLEKAAEEFGQAIKLKPNYAHAYHNLANTYEKMGKTEKAILNYQRAVSYNPGLWQSYQNLAAIYYRQGNVAVAKEYLGKVEEIKSGY